MPSVVYFTKEITPSSLVRIYDALKCTMSGNTAVKISTGEPPASHYLKPELIADLVHRVNGTIVECNTAYEGPRQQSKTHWKVIKDHGFMDIAKCDILDEDGDEGIPVVNGKFLKTNYVGTHMRNYNSMIILSHFKGHQMAGMGGALKNMSIGLASSFGKTHIHTYGKSTNPEDMFKAKTEWFIDAMADADKSIIDFFGKKNLCYINVANNISIDCDCNGHAKAPCMKDIGIFASLDPIAVDTACARAVYASNEDGKKDLIKRITDKHGLRILDAAQALGLGSKDYILMTI